MKWVRLPSMLLAAILLAASLFNSTARAASLVEVTNFGSNPSNLRMYLYVPNSVTARPAILVALHYCTGSGPAFYSGSEFSALADRYGFIVIYPSVTRSSKCFDVSSPQALRRDGGSDPVGIVSMVRYVLQNRNGDPTRVYVTGASSGAMMTNVMLGVYPDVFKAGAAFSGVPFGCFATSDGSDWNSACATGQIIKTPQQWGDLVRAAYPGYAGPRPRMQLWHGTEDTTLRYPNFGEEIKQWTNVFGLSQTPRTTDSPQPGWTHTRYVDGAGNLVVEGYSLQGVGHSLPQPGMAAQAIRFFGLDGPAPTATRTPTSGGTTVTRTPTPGTGVSYYRLTVRHSGKVADVLNRSLADGAAVVQWGWNGGTNQQWQFVPTDSGYYRIVNRNSGKCLDVNGASTADGGRVIQWACGSSSNQQWRIDDLGTGYSQLIARHSNKCLDVSGASTADGAQLQQWSCHSGTNQQWQRLP